jgi:hypothetical protein
MSPQSTQNVADPELERQGRRLGRPSGRFLLVSLVLAIPGIVLILLDHGWSVGVGIAILLIATIPAAVGAGLFGSSIVARWSARHKSFA